MQGPFEGLRSCGSLECYGVLEKISSKYAQCSLLESHGVGTLGSGHSSVFQDLALALVWRARLCCWIQAPQVSLSLASSLPKRLL